MVHSRDIAPNLFEEIELTQNFQVDFENPYEDDMKAVLGIPEKLRIICTVAVGYPTESPTKDRRPLEELVSYETYNG